jgi:hypothetical protein
LERTEALVKLAKLRLCDLDRKDTSATTEPHPDAEELADEMESAVVRLPPMQYEQLFDKVLEWKDQVRRLQPEPHPDAARLADEMDGCANRCDEHGHGKITAKTLHTWAADVRRIQPEPAKAPGVVYVLLDSDGLAISASVDQPKMEKGERWVLLKVHGAAEVEPDSEGACGTCGWFDLCLENGGRPEGGCGKGGDAVKYHAAHGRPIGTQDALPGMEEP